MLENSLFESQGNRRTRKPGTVIVSAIVHVITVAVLVLIPLLQTQAIVIPPVDTSLLLPRTERPANIQVFSEPTRRPRQSQSASNNFTAPQTIPQHILFDVDEPPAMDLPLEISSVGTGLSSLFPGPGNESIGIAVPEPPALQPPPPPPLIVDARPVRQGGDVQAANLIHQVKPVYPQIARTIRLQGVVVLEAVIGKEGSVDSLRVISGNPLLTPAALDAVKQWKYRPTMLNREPVEVITTITVTFALR